MSNSQNLTYALLDTGNQKKLEQFGPYKLIRPSSQSIWPPAMPHLWSAADAEFVRSGAETGHWRKITEKLPDFWTLRANDLIYTIEPNDFGNTGLFPEHWEHFAWMEDVIKTKLNYTNNDNFTFLETESVAKRLDAGLSRTVVKSKNSPTLDILNLFSYSGSNSLALVRAGHRLVQVDSSRQSMNLMTQNLKINRMEGKCRLVLEDAVKFLEKEVRRGVKYDGVILDPPNFGRGKKAEVFKLEKDLPHLLDLVKMILKLDFKFVLFSCHAAGYKPVMLQNLFLSLFDQPVEVGEVYLTDLKGRKLPAGIYARLGSGRLLSDSDQFKAKKKSSAQNRIKGGMGGDFKKSTNIRSPQKGKKIIKNTSQSKYQYSPGFRQNDKKKR